MAAVAACMFVSNVFAQRIKGSDTCLPLSQTEAENFINKNKSAKITVTGGGSGVGISALMEGTTDIAMSSRKMKFDEKVKLQEAKKSTKEVVIAYDALAVVVHPSNKVSNLTREHFHRKDQELERSGRRRHEDRSLFARNVFRNIRIL